jgi:hypothetical protein
MFYPNDCAGHLNQQAVCQIQNGQPVQVFTQRGTGSPEGAVTGLAVGLHQFWRTDGGGKMYIFNGTVGGNTGWVALN